MKCQICEKELVSTKSLSHVKTIHKIEIKDYYDKFLKDKDEGFCKQCGKETKFMGITKGYQKFCSLKCSNNNEDRKQEFSRTYKKNDIQLVKEKRSKTNLLRYGNSNVNVIPEIKNKIKETCLKKYNVPNPMMRKEISNKAYSNRKTKLPVSFKWKEYIMTSGKIVLIQGKENKLLDKLLMIFDENEISVHNNVPTIKYKDCNGKYRNHFPDIYVKRLNWIFECKCNYTWNPNEESRKNNILKYIEAKKQGFKYNVIIL